MKKSIFLTISLLGNLFFIFSSLTYDAAHRKSDNVGKVMFSVPVAPKSTIITNEHNIKKYLNKGYQIQNAWSSTYNHLDMYVVVKF